MTSTTRAGRRAAPAPEPTDGRSLWQRSVARLKGDYVEDGSNRPLRLPLWVDLSGALLVILFVVACWVFFFSWLAHTRV